MAKSELIGYARKSNLGSALKICLLKEAVDKAKTITGKDGTEYICLIINAAKVRLILNDEHEVTSVCQLFDESPQED